LGSRVCVLPPYFDGVGLVAKHAVCCVALAPAIAAHAGVRVEALPALDGDPGVVFLARVPCVLLECGGVDGEPNVHPLGTSKRLRIWGAGEGGEVGEVVVAVKVSFPAGLQAGGGRVVGG